MQVPIGIDNLLECLGCGKTNGMYIKNYIPIADRTNKNIIYAIHINFMCDECKSITTIAMSWILPCSIHFDFIKPYQAVNYHFYIQSPEWKAKADAAKERADHRCQLCNGDGVLHTHHRTYERLGNELPEDLIVLCANCHAKFHDKVPA
jgi:hypothetical protein